jgi:hypothetical protein
MSLVLEPLPWPEFDDAQGRENLHKLSDMKARKGGYFDDVRVVAESIERFAENFKYDANVNSDEDRAAAVVAQVDSVEVVDIKDDDSDGGCGKPCNGDSGDTPKHPVDNTSPEGPALICKELKDWLLPVCRDHKALLIKRAQNPVEFQQYVDILRESSALGQEDMKFPAGISKELLEPELTKKAHLLASCAVEHGLPERLGIQIQEDFQQIGMVLADLAPRSKSMSLSLGIMGEGSCRLWHRDNMVGRAIVTYNCCGTQYVADSNVNFEHLDCHCSEDIIRDESEIFSADVGDILLMKGMRFPGTPNGLVHRSPPWRRHEDGQIMKRFMLKVDVYDWY